MSAKQPPLIPEVGVLALPYHRWGDRWMTPHHVLTRLARYFHVVWLEPAHHWRQLASQQRLRHTPHELASILPDSFDRYVPEAWLPDIHRPNALRQALLRARVRRGWRRLERAGCTTRVLHLWHPRYEHALDVRPYDLALYHIDDEYSFSKNPERVGAQEARVLSKVDQIFAISPLLIERKSGINSNIEFAPEGVDFALYANRIAEPADLAPIPRPRVGYTGYLKRQLDWALLETLARAHPEWSFVFVGPRGTLPPPADGIFDRLASLKNVHMLGGKSVTDLAAYPQHFDVCTMPYTVDGYTNNIYPLKLHEYLASGQPVVGSPIRSLKDFTHVIALASTKDEWSAALADALRPALHAPDAAARRQDIARRNDWSELIHGIVETICRRLGPEFVGRAKRLDLGIDPRKTVVAEGAGPASGR